MVKHVWHQFISTKLIICLALVFFAVPAPILIFDQPAYSQAKKAEPPKRRRNIFDILFGKRGSLSAKPKNEKGKRVRLDANGNPIRRKRAAPAKPKVDKNPDAQKILVAGDFMADGLAWGLTQVYTENPNMVITSVAKGLSGFVRDDVKNWPADIGAHIDETKPIAVVFLAGMNDRQQMRLSTGRVSKLSEGWLTAYNARVQGVIDAVRAKKIPLIWVGLPPARSSKMFSDYLLFNDIYRTKVEAVKGYYVDVWDAFTNADGQFISAGPDVNGQIKRLRASDGINMTKTGKRKLAFYVERVIRTRLGLSTQDLFASLPGLEDSRPVAPQYDPAKSGTTTVYSLASPAIDGITTLEGGQIDRENKQAAKSVSYSLVIEGKLPYSHEGRVDYFGIASSKPKIHVTSPEELLKLEAQNLRHSKINGTHVR